MKNVAVVCDFEHDTWLEVQFGFVELAEGEAGIAPGQACVLYSDDGNDARVFGGGFIERSERSAQAEAMLSKLAARPAHMPAQ